MKKILYILLAISLFYSCDVEVENPNAPKETNYWINERNAELGVNAIYNIFYKPDSYSRWLWFRTDLTSDEGFSSSPWPELREWTQFNYINYNFLEGNTGTYKNFYQAIYRANQAIHYIPGITFKNEDNKNRLLGQAYFLRGLHYYNLALLWGSDNPSLAINLELSKPEMLPQGHTGKEVYEQAIKDFSEAQKLLPTEWTNSNDKGRATKGAALAFRAKTYMQLHKWNEAKEDLKWLVEGEGKGYYDLVANYQDNFKKDTENNIESVFEIQFSDAHLAPAGDGDFDINPNLGLNRGQFFAPPGIGWTDGELRPWIVNEFRKEKDLSNNIDKRLIATAFYDKMHIDFPKTDTMIYGDRYKSDTIWTKDNWKGRVFMRKYSSEHFRNYDDYHNPTNVRVLRFADVLLMYAECIAETGGAITDAAKYVDRVRARVNMPALSVNHATALASKDVFLKRLQMERVLELASEGHRWADIKRWGLLDSQSGIDELKGRDPDFTGFVIGKHNCLPISSTEVNNNPNIKQNPKY